MSIFQRLMIANFNDVMCETVTFVFFRQISAHTSYPTYVNISLIIEY